MVPLIDRACHAAHGFGNLGNFIHMAGFDQVYKKLVRVADLQDVSSSFVMEVIKSTTALPLDYVQLKK